LTNAFMQDIRYALRQLRKSPGFTLTALITLALGVGITAAVYSVIQTVLLEPLPYPDAGSLVGVAFAYPEDKPNAEETGGSADFVRDHSTEFSSTAVMDDRGQMVNLSINGGHATQVMALRVSEGYFRTFGVDPAIGRGFVGDEDRPNGPKAVVLSDGLWKRAFAGDPAIAGRVIRINEEPYTVVGVMPRRFAVNAESAPGVLTTPELWQPLQLGPKDPGYDGDNYEMIARLRPGVAFEQMRQHLSTLQQPFYQRYPDYKKWYSRDNELHTFRAWKLQDVVVSDVRRTLLTVMGAVVAVLLVACLNLAGLMTARAMRRTREIAVRSALGATRMQLLRLVLCEGLLLAAGGGALGVSVALLSVRVLLRASPLPMPTLRGEESTWLLGGIVALVALVAMAVFSALPTWMILRSQERLARLGWSMSGRAMLGETVSHARLSRVLMLAQVALAMVLISTASILLGTFVRLRALPSGVEPKQLTVFQVMLEGNAYARTQRTSQFVETVLDRLRRTPGVGNAAAVNGLPLDRGLNISGSPTDRTNLNQIIGLRTVTPGYFRTMGIALLEGRTIDESDHAGGAPVVVIGETAAKKWWPGRSPIGAYVRVGNEQNWRVVGVVADVRDRSLVETQRLQVYAPMVQLSDEFSAIINGWFSTTFAVRTAAHVNLAEAVQEAVTQADAEIPVARLSTMQAVIDDTIQEPRFFSLVAAGFSGFALVLTVIGLFGLLSYQVTQRTREIGVRMALGADRGAILRGFLGRGLVLASAGVGLGWAASWMMRPVMAHLLADAGVDMVNMSTGAAGVVMNATTAAAVAAGAIVAASMAASWVPARRAASVEPMQALRSE
jgi:predicted permease